MSVNYNRLKTMKGMAVGTIIPWAGGEDSIPKGWIACTGATKNVTDYPLLYDVIGYYYGGSSGFFRLPDLNAKTLCDMKSSYVPSGTSTVFTSQIGTNSSNISNQLYESNIALNVNISNNLASGNYSGRISGQTINPPTYYDELVIAQRSLGDHHMPTHSHSGTFNSIQEAGGMVEGCQVGGALPLNPIGQGCGFLSSQDCCDDQDLFRSEINNASDNVNNYFKTSIAGGYSMGGGGSSSFVDAVSLTNAPPRITSPLPKNWLGNGDDTLTKTGNFNFATTVNTIYNNWPSGSAGVDVSMSAHGHDAVSWSFNKASFEIQANVAVTDVGPGNVTPVNADWTDLLQFTANTATPSLRVMYIIKAW